MALLFIAYFYQQYDRSQLVSPLYLFHSVLLCIPMYIHKDTFC